MKKLKTILSTIAVMIIATSAAFAMNQTELRDYFESIIEVIHEPDRAHRLLL